MKRSTWLTLTLMCLVLSTASMFVPVLTYTFVGGKSVSFNVLGFLAPDELFQILADYTGSFIVDFHEGFVIFLATLAIIAIVAAFLGVITMSVQRPNYWQFIMAIIGLIGTLIPSLLIYLAVVLSINYFPGTFTLGVYPIITPIAMVICICMVTKKHKMTQAQIEAERLAAQYWHTGGNLK